MRFLGPVLVGLMLLLSAGGVAVRTEADAERTVKTSLVPAAPAAEQPRCEAPSEAPPASSGRIRVSERALGERRDALPLNGSGFNYRRPGVWSPELIIRQGQADAPDEGDPR